MLSSEDLDTDADPVQGQAAQAFIVELRPALELIRGRGGGVRRWCEESAVLASFEAEPDLAERAEEILEAALGR